MQGSELLTPERQALIEARLQANGRVLAGQLASELSVSVDTIRRDLRELAAVGRCRRVYGGALPPAPRPGNHQQRVGLMTERKQMLADAAASLISADMTIFVDAGTTNLSAIKALPMEMPLAIVTNAPAIAAFVLDRPKWRLIQIGGEVDLATGGAVGAMAMRNMSAVMPDLALIGTCGFDVQLGLSAHTLDEGELKRFVAERSGQTVAALTDDKLVTRAPFGFLATSACSHIIFEATAPQDIIAETGKLGVNVLVADPLTDGSDRG